MRRIIQSLQCEMSGAGCLACDHTDHVAMEVFSDGYIHQKVFNFLSTNNHQFIAMLTLLTVSALSSTYCAAAAAYCGQGPGV